MTARERDTMNVDEAADYLRSTPRYIRKLAAAGKIPCSKPFGRLIFSKVKLDEIIRNSERRSEADLADEAARRLAEITAKRKKKGLKV